MPRSLLQEASIVNDIAMKISIVIGSFYPAVVYGGPIFSTLNISRELARNGSTVYVSTTNANGDAQLDVETDRFIELENNLFVKYYGGGDRAAFSWRLLFNLWKDIRQADVVYINAVFSSYVPAALFYSRIFKKPVLLSPRGSLAEWCMNSRRSLIKRFWLHLMITPFAGRIVWHATSEQEKENIRAVYPRSSVAVIPNGIDLSEFDDHEDISRERYFSRFARGSCSPTHIVISMGRLHKKKGFDILIDSFDSIKTEFPGVVLLIAGPDGGEGEALRSQIKRLNLHDRVFLIGEIQGKDKVDFLANADLFALPSHDENFGNVYAESLAAGTPIVASTNTPWAEIERFNCGKWISNNITTTAVAMRDMLNADLETMGRNGKRFVTDNYSWSSVVSRFDRVFKELKDRNKVE